MVTADLVRVSGPDHRKRRAHSRGMSDVWWLCARLFVVAVAAISVAAGAGPEVRAPLTIAACVAVFEPIARRWGENGPVRLLIVSGSILVSLALTGLVLDLAPGGISRPGWAVALGVLGAIALVGAGPAVWRPGQLRLRPRMRPETPWYAASLIVAALALAMSAERSPSARTGPAAAVLSCNPGHRRRSRSRPPAAPPPDRWRSSKGPGSDGTVLAGPVRVSASQPLLLRASVPAGHDLQLQLVTVGPGQRVTSIRAAACGGIVSTGRTSPAVGSERNRRRPSRWRRPAGGPAAPPGPPGLPGGRQRICVVGSGWRFVSGISVYSCRLANAFAEEHQVSAILMRRLLPRRLYPGAERVGADLMNLRYRDDVDVFDGVDYFWLPSMFRAVGFLHRRRPDVVLFQWWSGTVLHSYLLLALVSRLLGARVIIEFHEVLDTAEASRSLARIYVKFLMRPLLRLSTAYVVHSEFDQHAVRSHFGLSDAVVVPHGPYDHLRGGREAVPATRMPTGSARCCTSGPSGRTRVSSTS